ncbi:helix-turn-helix domain-containing protein [Magnetococcus sp. PR-3]|uniref:helix-turn-helix domain-containing protein n=1 Tax=Magnetococcus sp. PR-3 TaxID=3120355 RepID=UPI002FCE5568
MKTLDTPTPEQIKQARKSAGLTQEGAAVLIHRKGRAWRKWEGQNHSMDLAIWELFLIKSNQLHLATYTNTMPT